MEGLLGSARSRSRSGAGRATPGDDDAPDSQARDAPRARAAACYGRTSRHARARLCAPRFEPRKVVDHAEAAPGDLLTYTIQIENHGTHASAAGAVTDALPAHTTFVSATGGCTAAGAIISCPLGPVAVGATVSITVIVRVDADAPGGRSRQHGRRDGARRPAHHEQPRRGDDEGALRRPRRLRVVGSESRRPPDRRRARLRRRDGAPLRRLRRARGHDHDRRRRVLPLRPAATADDLRGVPRRARRQRRRRPARGLRADGRERRQSTTRSTPTPRSATARRASPPPPPALRARSSRPTTSASGSRRRSATACGWT